MNFQIGEIIWFDFKSKQSYIFKLIGPPGGGKGTPGPAGPKGPRGMLIHWRTLIIKCWKIVEFSHSKVLAHIDNFHTFYGFFLVDLIFLNFICFYHNQMFILNVIFLNFEMLISLIQNIELDLAANVCSYILYMQVIRQLQSVRSLMFHNCHKNLWKVLNVKYLVLL